MKGQTMRRFLAALLFVSVPAIADAQLKVMWDANTEPEVIGYRVYVGPELGVYTFNYDVSGTTFEFRAGTPGQRYYFAVVARASVPCDCVVSTDVVSGVYPEQPDTSTPSPEGTYASENNGQIVDTQLNLWTVVNTEFSCNGVFANNTGDMLSYRGGVVSGRAGTRWVSRIGSCDGVWKEAGTTEPGLPTQPVDCVPSEWGPWSEWSAWTPTELHTEQRMRTRTRTIVTQPSGGGAACGPLTETETESRSLVDVCATDPLTITGIRWPTAPTGNKSGMWNSGSKALASVQFQWAPTLRLTATDTRGCIVTVVK